MNKSEKYLPIELEVITIQIEKGYANSTLDGGAGLENLRDGGPAW